MRRVAGVTSLATTSSQPLLVRGRMAVKMSPGCITERVYFERHRKADLLQRTYLSATSISPRALAFRLRQLIEFVH